MSSAKKRSVNERFIIISTIVVAILLIISIFLLLLLSRHQSGSSSLWGNVIGPGGDVIRLKNVDSLAEAQLNAENMFPGDCETKTYYVEILDSSIEAYRFKAEVASEHAALSDVLMISVTANGTEDALYSGLVKDMPTDIRASVGNDPQNNEFTISVSLDTNVGNEYQADEILLNFMWWVDDSDYVGGSTSGDGHKCCPWCFGVCPWCWILLLILVLLLLIIIGVFVGVIIRKKKQKEAILTGAASAAKDGESLDPKNKNDK